MYLVLNRGLDKPLNLNTQLKVKVIEIGENCIIRVEEASNNQLFLETRTWSIFFSRKCMLFRAIEARNGARESGLLEKDFSLLSGF